MQRSPTLAILGLFVGLGACCALLMAALAARADVVLVGGLFPRGPYAFAAFGYGVASLIAARGLWRQGDGLAPALTIWAVLGSLCILGFGLAARGRMAITLGMYLGISAPFLLVPWGASWYISRLRKLAQPDDRRS